MMSKKQKQQKRLIRELEAALAQTLSDWAIERQVNRSLAEERDAAEKDVAELLRDEEASTSCIRDLRRFVAQLQEERDELRLELAGMTSDVALDAALADVKTLTDANAEADATIGNLRACLRKSANHNRELLDMVKSTQSERDAALVKADATIGELRALVEQQRKDWSGDVEASREIIARKTEEYIKLRRDSADTISELRGDLAKVRGDLERVTESWQHAEDLLQARERELDALRDQQAQQEHAEPVVTLEAIEELEEGERLVDEDGVIIESVPGGYEVQGAILTTHVGALQYYHEITGK